MSRCQAVGGHIARISLLAGLCIVLCSCRTASPAPLLGTGGQVANDTGLKHLVEEIGGESFRETCVPRNTDADLACEKLVKIGKPAVPYLLDALNSPKGWARVHAMEVLATTKDHRAVKPMLAILHKDPENGVRGIAACNLGAFGDKAVVPDLLEAANSKDKDIRSGAWVSLGDLREPKAIPILVRNLDARVLPWMGSQTILDRTPIEALTKIGSPAVPDLIEAFKTFRGDAKLSAAMALGGIGTDPATATLRAALANPLTHQVALDGFFESTKPEAVAVGIKALSDPKYRGDAACYFNRCPTAESRRALRQAMAVAKKRHEATKLKFLASLLKSSSR